VGFTHYCGKTKKGHFKVKRRTSRKKLGAALRAFSDWARKARHKLIMWHRRDHFAWSKIGRTQCARRVRAKDGAHQTRRETENTNFVLPLGECPAYSKTRPVCAGLFPWPLGLESRPSLQ